MAPKPDPSPSNAQRNAPNVARAKARIMRGGSFTQRTLVRLQSAGYTGEQIRKLISDSPQSSRNTAAQLYANRVNQGRKAFRKTTKS